MPVSDHSQDSDSNDSHASSEHDRAHRQRRGQVGSEDEGGHHDANDDSDEEYGVSLGISSPVPLLTVFMDDSEPLQRWERAANQCLSHWSTPSAQSRRKAALQCQTPSDDKGGVHT